MGFKVEEERQEEKEEEWNEIKKRERERRMSAERQKEIQFHEMPGAGGAAGAASAAETREMTSVRPPQRFPFHRQMKSQDQFSSW